MKPGQAENNSNSHMSLHLTQEKKTDILVKGLVSTVFYWSSKEFTAEQSLSPFVDAGVSFWDSLLILETSIPKAYLWNFIS